MICRPLSAHALPCCCALLDPALWVRSPRVYRVALLRTLSLSKQVPALLPRCSARVSRDAGLCPRQPLWRAALAACASSPAPTAAIADLHDSEAWLSSRASEPAHIHHGDDLHDAEGWRTAHGAQR